MKLLPLTSMIVFPLKTPYKFMYKHAPNQTKKVKLYIVDNLRKVKQIKTPKINAVVKDSYY